MSDSYSYTGDPTADNYYDILGVPETADKKTIEKTAKRAKIELKNSDQEYERRIQNAQQTLTEDREAYDTFLNRTDISDGHEVYLRWTNKGRPNIAKTWVPLSEIRIIVNNENEIYPDQKVEYRVQAQYYDGNTKDITNEAEVTVDTNDGVIGVIKEGEQKMIETKRKGKAEISATYYSDSHAIEQDEKTINITNRVSDIILSIKKNIMVVGETTTVHVTARYTDGREETVTSDVSFHATNENLSFTEYGTIEALESGVTQIEAKYEDCYATAELIVVSKEKLHIDVDKRFISPGQEIPFRVYLEDTPGADPTSEDATLKDITDKISGAEYSSASAFSTSDKNVLEITNSVIRGCNEGQACINFHINDVTVSSPLINVESPHRYPSDDPEITPIEEIDDSYTENNERTPPPEQTATPPWLQRKKNDLEAYLHNVSPVLASLVPLLYGVSWLLVVPLSWLIFLTAFLAMVAGGIGFVGWSVIGLISGDWSEAIRMGIVTIVSLVAAFVFAHILDQFHRG